MSREYPLDYVKFFDGRAFERQPGIDLTAFFDDEDVLHVRVAYSGVSAPILEVERVRVPGKYTLIDEGGQRRETHASEIGIGVMRIEPIRWAPWVTRDKRSALRTRLHSDLRDARLKVWKRDGRAPINTLSWCPIDSYPEHWEWLLRETLLRKEERS